MTDRVSLDLESVLSSVHHKFLEEYNERHGTDWVIEDWTTWDFGRTDVGLEEFMDLTHEIWQERWDEIPTCEPNLDDTVARLRETHEVDLVTSRVNCDEQCQAWLDKHGIEYRKFRSCDPGTKQQYAPVYDAFIDDSPHLHHNVSTQYLVKQPWNQHVRDEQGVIPVDSVAEAVELLQD